MVLFSRSLLRFAIIAIAVNMCASFYLPGVNPQSFRIGDRINLKVNKLTSKDALFPIDYYRLPFCLPEGGPRMDNENLGEFLSGDRIESSPYIIHMKLDVFCSQLCITNLGRPEQFGMTPNKVVRAIRNGYRHNWIMDNMDSAQLQIVSSAEGGYDNDTAAATTTTSTLLTLYGQGFPLGFIGNDQEGTSRAYIYNHVNIEIMYHEIPEEEELYRVVGFSVQPFSIRHDFELLNRHDDNDEYDNRGNFVKIENPISSCDRSVSENERKHTNANMLMGEQPMEATGQVLFTYDVIWKKSDQSWANRWDAYLEQGMIELHANSIKDLDCFIILVLLLAVIVQKVRLDLKSTTQRNEQDLEQKEDTEKEETGNDDMADLPSSPLLSNNNSESKEEEEEEGAAKSYETIPEPFIFQNLFRPPLTLPTYFAVALGTGIQLICTLFVVLWFAALGFLSAPRRGSLVMAILIVFCLFGCLGGFVTGQIHRMFHGSDKLPLLQLTVLGFPGLCFAMLCVRSLLALALGSTLAIPVMTVLVLCLLGAFLLFPSTALGMYIGYHDSLSYSQSISLMISKFVSSLHGVNPSIWIGVLVCGVVLSEGELLIGLFQALFLSLPFLGVGLLLLRITSKSAIFGIIYDSVPRYSLGVTRPATKGSWLLKVPVAVGLLSNVTMVLVENDVCLRVVGIGMVLAFVYSRDATWPYVYTGVLPYAVLWPYYIYMYRAFWGLQYYDPSGATLLIATLLYFATVGLVTILFTYQTLLRVQEKEEQSCRFHWWNVFSAAGSNALYFFFQPGGMGPKLSLSTAQGYYYTNMTLVSCSVFLVSGAWGIFCSIWFVRLVFRLQSREIETAAAAVDDVSVLDGNEASDKQGSSPLPPVDAENGEASKNDTTLAAAIDSTAGVEKSASEAEVAE